MRVTIIRLLLHVGASSGIGAGAAIHFASLGCRLAICGRNEENLKTVAKQCTETGLPEEKVAINCSLMNVIYI